MKGLKLPRPILKDEELLPKLLRIIYWDQAKYDPVGKRGDRRHVWDYELEYITFSEGGELVGDKFYKLQKGDLLLKRPGQYTQGQFPYACYILGLDMSEKGLRIEKNSDFCHTNQFVPDYDHPLLNDLPAFIRPRKPEEFRHLIHEILKLQMSQDPLKVIRIRGLLFQLLVQMYNESQKESHSLYSPNGTMMSNLKLYIEENLEEKLSLDRLSKVAGMSKAHFQKTFKKYIGLSPNQYVQKIRVEKAKTMLVMERHSIIDIAVECGFERASYFATVFSKQTNMSPTAYRKLYTDRE